MHPNAGSNNPISDNRQELFEGREVTSEQEMPKWGEFESDWIFLYSGHTGRDASGIGSSSGTSRSAGTIPGIIGTVGSGRSFANPRNLGDHGGCSADEQDDGWKILSARRAAAPDQPFNFK